MYEVCCLLNMKKVTFAINVTEVRLLSPITQAPCDWPRKMQAYALLLFGAAVTRRENDV